MKLPDEHDDDLEAEVEEGMAIETERYEHEEEEHEISPSADAAHAPERPHPDSTDAKLEQNPDDEASGTI